MKDQATIFSAMCLHYTILAIKAELDQLVKELETLDILSLLREHPTAACPLYIHSDGHREMCLIFSILS